MCGLVGFMNYGNRANAIDRGNFMEQGLIIDMLRGEDSTGIFYGKKKCTTAGYVKSAKNGIDFVNSTEWDTAAKGLSEWQFCVGHNRAATIGNIETATAHPFIEGPVTAVHNGTIRGNMDLLPITFKQADVPVDSWALTKNLAHVDPDEVTEKVLRNITGAYALIWFDGRDGSLNFARNNTRPLHFMQSYTNKTIYFASEPGQLHWLNQRIKLGGSDVLFLEAGQHLKFTEDSIVPAVQEYALHPKAATVTKPNRRRGTKSGKGQQTSITTATQADGEDKLRAQGYVPGKQPGVWVKGMKTTITNPDRVLLGGKKRNLPEPCLSLLSEMCLTVKDRLSFTPMAVQDQKYLKSKVSKRYVAGFLDSLSANAMIYSVDSHVADKAFDRRWTVRPVAVKYADAERTTPIVICLLVASVSQPEVMMFKKTIKEALAPALPVCLPPVSQASSIKETPVTIGGVRGPTGDFISKDEWMELTEDGCWACDQPIQLLDAPDIKWQLDPNAVYPKPVCVACCKEDEKATELVAIASKNSNQTVH